MIQIEEKLANLVNRHSYFQLRHFVVGKEPTIQAKLYRCLQELQVRLKDIRAIKLQIEETIDDLALLNIKIEKLASKQADGLSDEGLIHIRKLERKKISLGTVLDELKQKLKAQEEESAFFTESFQALEKIEKLKPYDDFEAQQDFWNKKLSHEIELNLLANRTLNIEVLKSILALPDDQPIKKDTMQFLEKSKLLIKNDKNNQS